MIASGTARETLRLRVVAVTSLTARIKAFELASEAGPLPAFEAGAHVGIETVEGSRSYSLANDPAERHRYVVAVLRTTDGIGSAWMHDRVSPGDWLDVSAPLNAFRLAEEAREHILIAGGVGITPIRAMAYRLAAIGAKFRVFYCTRAPEDTAFQSELKDAFGDRLAVHHDGGDPARSFDFSALLTERPDDAHVYVCGPRSMIAAVREAARHWPAASIHAEVFASPRATAAGAARADTADAPFEVEIAGSGELFAIPPESSILDVLLEAGLNLPYVCKEGWCGNCQADLVSGRAEHRDELLSEEEKAQNKVIQICVSRAPAGERLVIAPRQPAPATVLAGATGEPGPRRDSILKPMILSRGTLVTRDLQRARLLCEQFLGLECVDAGLGRMLVRDRDPEVIRHRRGGAYWVMDVMESAEGVQTNLFKHWGIEVRSEEEVDRVHAFAEANQEALGLAAVRKPRMQHGTYSFYAEDLDTNWWEVECRPPGDSTDEIFARGDNGHWSS